MICDTLCNIVCAYLLLLSLFIVVFFSVVFCACTVKSCVYLHAHTTSWKNYSEIFDQIILLPIGGRIRVSCTTAVRTHVYCSRYAWHVAAVCRFRSDFVCNFKYLFNPVACLMRWAASFNHITSIANMPVDAIYFMFIKCLFANVIRPIYASLCN